MTARQKFDTYASASLIVSTPLNGEGRNSVWLARQGFVVEAFDIAEVGVANARRSVVLAEQAVKDRQDALLALIGQFQLDESLGAVGFGEVEQRHRRQCRAAAVVIPRSVHAQKCAFWPCCRRRRRKSSLLCFQLTV